MDFYTLQDFLNFTKGSAYVMMLVVAVAFIPFWLFLTDREEKEWYVRKERSIIPVTTWQTIS